MPRGDKSSSGGLRSSPEEREALYLAEHTDVSVRQARELIRQHGTDRRTLLEKARTIKAES